MAEDGLMEQLTGFLSSEEGIRQLQNAARMLGLGGQQQGNGPDLSSVLSDTGHREESFADPQMMLKVAKLVQTVRRETPSSVFLRALKPLLREERQGRVEDAIRMMQLFSLLPMLKEME